ncbi:MAG: hypothetical protein M1118_07885 [Chloroflexi bacterium]|nr:hypothetical protein [Chloroflexota bacterium]
MSDQDTRLEELEQRLADLESELRSRRRSRLNVGTVLREVMPPEVRAHLRAAQRERLLAVRAYLDRALARVDHDSSESSSL